ncbi:hypothetical protein pb186bvf_003456 [Paramecium bursaria]
MRAIIKPCFQFARYVRVVNKLKQQAPFDEGEDQGFSIPFNQQKQSAPPPPPKTEKEIKDEEIDLIRKTVLFKGDDPFYEKVVERPQKGQVWGLEGQLMERKEVPSTTDKEVTLQKIASFLELNQIKEIVDHDLYKYEKYHPQRYGLIGTMYSSQHGWKVCRELLKWFMTLYNEELAQAKKVKEALAEEAFMNPEKRGEINLKKQSMIEVPFGKPSISGAKDDEWLMISYKEFMIHLFTEESRNEVDIEAKWMYQQDPDTEDEFQKLIDKGKKGHFEPLK